MQQASVGHWVGKLGELVGVSVVAVVVAEYIFDRHDHD